MSIEAMAIVLNHSRAKGAAKLVLLGIANHINPDNDGAWPSQAKLAAYANVSDRSVRDAIETLVALGELHYQVGAGQSGTQYKTNRYWLDLRCPEDCDGTANHRRVEVSDSQGGSFRQSGWKQASDKPLEEPKVEPTLAQDRLEPAFSEFWKAYPRKVGKVAAKKAFAKAWTSLSSQGGEPTDILTGVALFARDPNKPSKEFLPHPSTWLNEGRWDDEPYPEREKTKEELEAIRAEHYKRQREIELAEAAKRRAEAKEIEERLKANPVTRCEHDRVKVICPICSK